MYRYSIFMYIVGNYQGRPLAPRDWNPLTVTLSQVYSHRVGQAYQELQLA
jgi:hypothetical protein